MRSFQWIVLTPPGLIDPSIAIAASQSGVWGVLDLEYCNDETAAVRAIEELARSASGLCGVKLPGRRKEFLSAVIQNLPQRIGLVLLTATDGKEVAAAIHSLLGRGITVLWESISAENAERGARLGVHGIVAKGSEAGGFVGEETSFVLLQHILASTRLPVWVHGGVGLHTSAACYVAGAAGAVLDSQLWLTKESNLPEIARTAIGHMDGSETVCLGNGLDASCRVYWRPGRPVLEELRKTADGVVEAPQSKNQKASLWRQFVEQRVGWSSTDQVWLLGQDACFAAGLARRFKSVHDVVSALIESTSLHVSAAQKLKPLNENSPMANSHGTRYPIVQGPMTRVSDTAEFADAVATGGGLPFLALALMRGPEVDNLLRDTTRVLTGKPWGVGILGFVPAELRQEQLEVVRRYRPPFALIAGGRPDQARVLEQEGIVTYLHVPSPGLLRMFLENGARHFVFEGRECGGHVGPRSSFVLWESMIEVLLDSLPENGAAKCHVLFAGGIHDGLSGSMVAAMAAPLAERGVKIGVLVGTAYLFTKEAVEAGAIVRTFQREALRCDRTVLLETGPGHAIRCVPTPYVDYFQQQKGHLEATAPSAEEARIALEMLNVGRLRIASKGITRPSSPEQGKPSGDEFIKLSQTEQRQDGMYMIGQVAALRKEICTIQELHRSIAVNSTERLLRVESLLWKGTAHRSKDIAIVGMACILPKAGDLQTYWENILAKVDAITEVPKERWDWKKYYDPDPSAPDKSYSKWGGFLDDVPFDPLNYGIPPNALSSIEPLQLLTLEVARRALDHAGYKNRPFSRERASVILGVGGGGADLAQRYGTRVAMTAANSASDSDSGTPQELPKWTEDSFPGMLSNVAAGRVANRFDFGGVNYTVDAACASSLAAIYHAVNELEAGTSDLVIAGGSDTVQSPFAYVCFSKTHAFSFQGRCRTFDESADGIAISEGVAAVVLKRLSDAQRDGDRIYAVIKGIAGSSDGRDKSLTAPRVEGQLLALKRAYAKAGVSPSTVKLIEAHGTGTVAGDQAEIEALRRLFESSGVPKESCAVGSVKSLIGHTKATAGVAGIIKATLALHHRVLPPTGGVDKPNSKARFQESPFYINSELRPWINSEADEPRRAGVSAFGFGGTNFHAVLEEYPANTEPRAAWQRWPGELFLWASRSREEMIAVLSNLDRVISENANLELFELASSLWQQTKKDAATLNGSTRLRLAIVATSLEDLRQKLRTASENLKNPACNRLQDPRGLYLNLQAFTAEGQIAFLFPGQGSQYVGMLRDLAIQFPEVRERFEMADRVLRAELSAPLSSYVFPPPSFTPQEQQSRQQKLIQTNVAQPALGAAGLAMFRLLESLAVRPNYVAGHSYGEYVALCSAGAFGEEMLVKISEARGRLIREGTTTESGTMAAVDANATTVKELLRGIEEVWIANLNSPRQTTISGTKRGIESACEKLKASGTQFHALPVACAFHSPVISSVRDQLAKWLEQVEFAKPRFGVFSNTSAALYPASPDDFASFLAEHMVRPVDFVGEINAMYQAGARVFVEVGPRNVLTGLTSQILDGRPHLAIATDISGRPGLLQLQHALGELFACAVPVQLDRLFEGRKRNDLNLDDLLVQSRKRTLSATTWMVNGGRACPISQLGKTQPVPQPSVQPVSKPKADPVTTVPVHNFPPTLLPQETETASPVVVSLPVSSTPSVQANRPLSSGSSGAVMMQFNQLMSRFLTTQKEVMLSCLHGGNGHSIVPQSVGRVADAKIIDQPSLAPVPSVTKPRPAVQLAAINSVQESATPEPSAPVAQSEAEAPDEVKPDKMDERKVRAELLKVVNERTGYPEDMLGLEVDIEAELGIDSIKRVEILSVFVQRCVPSTITVDMEELTKIRTLNAIVQRTLDVLAQHDENPEVQNAITTPGSDATPRIDEDESELARFVMVPEDAQLTYIQSPKFPKSVVVITDDENGIALAVRQELTRNRVPTVLLRMKESAEESEDLYAADLGDPDSVRAIVERIRQSKGPIAGIIHLLPFRGAVDFDTMQSDACRERLRTDVKSLFYLAKAAGPDLLAQAKSGPSWICVPIDLDTLMPTQMAHSFPGHGALRGMVKTLAAEWPNVVCKIVGTQRSRSTEELAGSIISEIAGGNQEVEIGFDGHRRLAIRPQRKPHSVPSNGIVIDSKSVILITGGARGITSEAARLLAKHKSTLVLVGRTPFPQAEEPEYFAQCSSPAELKKRLIEHMRQQGRRTTPSEVESACRVLLHEREIRQNVASLRQLGATVQYFHADVRDEHQIREILERTYQTYGRLDGVIHGAGIIEDKLVEEKTPESFNRVFDTKVDSTIIMAKLLRIESLKFFVLFSSVSGAFGNRGQVDYAAANAAMDSIAAYLDQRWPGRVVSINWGPWDKVGMVSDLVRTQMTQRGVQLISNATGVHALEQEIYRSKKGDAQVVLGGGPWDVSSTSPSKQIAILPHVAAPTAAVVLATA